LAIGETEAEEEKSNREIAGAAERAQSDNGSSAAVTSPTTTTYTTSSRFLGRIARLFGGAKQASAEATPTAVSQGTSQNPTALSPAAEVKQSSSGQGAAKAASEERTVADKAETSGPVSTRTNPVEKQFRQILEFADARLQELETETPTGSKTAEPFSEDERSSLLSRIETLETQLTSARSARTSSEMELEKIRTERERWTAAEAERKKKDAAERDRQSSEQEELRSLRQQSEELRGKIGELQAELEKAGAISEASSQDEKELNEQASPTTSPSGKLELPLPGPFAEALHQQVMAPLTVLVASADLALLSAKDPRVRENLEELRRQAQALVKIIKEFTLPPETRGSH
jgi:DNA repair exonuclease SbcCD ATPase subunit